MKKIVVYINIKKINSKFLIYISNYNKYYYVSKKKLKKIIINCNKIYFYEDIFIKINSYLSIFNNVLCLE